MVGTIILISAFVFAAMVLFLLEILTPSFGLFGAMGVLSLAGAVWQGFSLNSITGWAVMTGVVVVAPVYVVAMIKILPNTALGRHVFLAKAPDGIGEGTPEADKYDALVGKTGTAESVLRPSGAVRVDDMRVIATAESGMIDKGQAVKVVRASATNVIVRPVSQNQQT